MPREADILSQIENLSSYFSGEKLYGDDFSFEELKRWYELEKEGYASEFAADPSDYIYQYQALNAAMFYRHLPPKRFKHVLGFGSAYGEELAPIIDRIEKITILEPSEKYRTSELHGVPVHYVAPQVDGKIDFPDSEFDLIVCSAALHHVAPVSKTVSEFSRCLKPGGYALVREPTVSMGDWRRPRRGLTKCERGIPLPLLDRIILSAGFDEIRRTRCVFPVIGRLGGLVKKPIYNSRLAVIADSVLSRLFAWNMHYHPTKFWQKLQPVAVAYVLEKRRETPTARSLQD